MSAVFNYSQQEEGKDFTGLKYSNDSRTGAQEMIRFPDPSSPNFSCSLISFSADDKRTREIEERRERERERQRERQREREIKTRFFQEYQKDHKIKSLTISPSNQHLYRYYKSWLRDNFPTINPGSTWDFSSFIYHLED